MHTHREFDVGSVLRGSLGFQCGQLRVYLYHRCRFLVAVLQRIFKLGRQISGRRSRFFQILACLLVRHFFIGELELKLLQLGLGESKIELQGAGLKIETKSTCQKVG